VPGELEIYMRGLKDLKILTREEEKELFKRIRVGEREARGILIKHNMKFALKVALQYKPRHLTTADLLSEATIGLSIAVDKFDPSTGLKFISYAVWWIRASINRAISDKDNIIRIPSHATNDLKKALKKLKYIEDPSSEIKKVIDISNTGTLDEPLSNSKGEETLKDFLVYEEENNFNSLESFEVKAAIEEVLAVFTVKDSKCKDVFTRIFGLKSGTPETLEDIALDMDITRERVRQIKLKAYDIVSKRFIRGKLGRLEDLEQSLKYVR
jgi:RNA polymerase primary sigma factor